MTAPSSRDALPTDIDKSNSLADLAGRIQAEHGAVSAALKDGVRHAINAGELLIEAKGQIAHGQWLPWLRDHCAISERTAQLYMRVAKNRKEIEEQIRTGVADLSLNEAAALLILSSDVKNLFEFVKNIENAETPEQIVQAAIDGRVGLLGVVSTPGYEVFAHCDESGEREWWLFHLFLCAEWDGYYVDSAARHIEWISQRQFLTPDEWLGDEGVKFRRIYGMPNPTETFISLWAAFKTRHNEKTLAQIIADLDALHKERGPAPDLPPLRPLRLRKTRRRSRSEAA
jgi:hypothetical protein